MDMKFIYILGHELKFALALQLCWAASALIINTN